LPPIRLLPFECGFRRFTELHRHDERRGDEIGWLFLQTDVLQHRGQVAPDVQPGLLAVSARERGIRGTFGGRIV